MMFFFQNALCIFFLVSCEHLLHDNNLLADHAGSSPERCLRSSAGWCFVGTLGIDSFRVEISHELASWKKIQVTARSAESQKAVLSACFSE